MIVSRKRYGRLGPNLEEEVWNGRDLRRPRIIGPKIAQTIEAMVRAPHRGKGQLELFGPAGSRSAA